MNTGPVLVDRSSTPPPDLYVEITKPPVAQSDSSVSKFIGSVSNFLHLIFGSSKHVSTSECDKTIAFLEKLEVESSSERFHVYTHAAYKISQSDYDFESKSGRNKIYNRITDIASEILIDQIQNRTFQGLPESTSDKQLLSVYSVIYEKALQILLKALHG